MNKKILSGLAVLLVILAGGYFYTKKINSQIEEIAEQTLADYNIKHSAIKYNCLNKTLMIKDIAFPYDSKNIKIDNTAEEILIKGVNADSFKKDTDEAMLLCKELIFNTVKSTVYAYDNEELETTTKKISIKKPVLNLQKLISLHATMPYSEEYFQNILNIRHDGIVFDNINMQAFKDSENNMSFAIDTIEFPAFRENNFDIFYKNINIASSPINIKAAEIALQNITLPTAEYLATLSKTVIRLNELERYLDYANDSLSLLEYEELSEMLLSQLSYQDSTPLMSNIKIADIAFSFNEIDEVAETPITIKELAYAINENDKTLIINSELEQLTIANNFLQHVVTPKSLELFKQKFTNGMIISLGHNAEYTKETGRYTQDTKRSVDNLAELTAKTAGFVLNNDKSVFLSNYNTFLSGLTEYDLDKILNTVILKNLQVSYADTGFIDFAFKIAAQETGMPADKVKEQALATLEMEKNTIADIEERTTFDNDVIKVIDTLMETINNTGKFLIGITFDDELTLNELINATNAPAYTLEVNAK